MKNIAIIITKLNGGGAERCASNLSIELSKLHNVYLIVFDASNMTYTHSGEFFNLKIPNNKNKIIKIINVIRRISSVRKIKRNKNIDYTISLLDGPNFINTLSRVDDKIIISIRNRLSAEPMSFLRKKIVVFCCKYADLTVSLSKMVKYDLIEEFKVKDEKIRIIYNHCDRELLYRLCQKSSKPEYIDDNSIFICTIGRLSYQKGHCHLIRVFSEVKRSIPNLKLIIIGTGELEGKLKQLAINLKIEDSVIFTGYIENPHHILKYCEMFVFTSLFEGLGNVLLEALAFDMPIISTDCVAGPREILSPETSLNVKIKSYELAKYGILVPVMEGSIFDFEIKLTNQEIQLYESILIMHNDHQIREYYKDSARKRIDDFKIDKIIRLWEDCFI